MKKLHGLATRKNRHPLFGRWKQMRQRCENPKDSSYKDYGGRGIFVCKRWESFQNFIEDMAGTFIPGLTLERRNNNGPYAPYNCEWATAKRQRNNSRYIHYITLADLKLNLQQWSEKIGINPNTIRNRLAAGWSIERALTLKPKSGGHY